MTQEQLDAATGEITRILTPYHKHAGERAANIVMALQGCDDSLNDVLDAIREALPGSNPALVGSIAHAWTAHTACSR